MARISHFVRRSPLVAAAALSAGALALGGTAAAAAPARSPALGTRVVGAAAGANEVGTWAASPAPVDTSGVSATGFTDQTVRDVVHTSVGGNQVRIRLSNAFGTKPVTINDARVGLRDVGASVYPGTNQQVLFGGRRSATIPVGAEELSDPVSLRVGAEQDLAVSLFFRNATGPATWHPLGTSTTYYSDAGDRAGSLSAGPYTHTVQSWFFLDGVDVTRASKTASVVAFGDSITDGYQSTVDANLRWPDDLARRLDARPADQRMSVLDEGISGNRILSDAGTSGVSALERFDRDALAQTGVRDVIFLEGINDIGNNAGALPGKPVTAAALIAGMQNIIARAHARGLTILGGTLTPYQGAFYYTAAGERKREAVNTWIRTSGAFDGVIDFDKTTRDPAHPKRFLPQYDSGDHLHPNDAGYQAMADVINLSKL